LTDAAGGVYEGEYHDDKLHGDKCRARLPDGSVYEGAMRHGANHGPGRLALPDGTEYEGEWAHGRLHGDSCRCHRPTAGETFVGAWRDGEMHGRCTVMWAQEPATRLEGTWVRGVQQNRCVITTATTRYDGEVKAGSQTTPHGRGTYTDTVTGFSYDGEFADGEMHGWGRACDGDGTYDGEWRHNQRHGRGAAVGAAGGRLDGVWAGGLLHGADCRMAWPDGSVYEGEMAQGRRHGQGRMVHTHPHATYNGLWHDDAPCDAAPLPPRS
jgi:hypothetical protein